MLPMTQNPETGFLEQTSLGEAFTSALKERVLRYLETHPFMIRAACETVGVDVSSFYRHLKLDPIFRQSYQALKDRRVEQAEERLSQMAVESDAPAWNIFFLKAHKPDVYNPRPSTENSLHITLDMTRASAAISTESAPAIVDVQPIPLENPLEK